MYVLFLGVGVAPPLVVVDWLLLSLHLRIVKCDLAMYVDLQLGFYIPNTIVRVGASTRPYIKTKSENRSLYGFKRTQV